MIKINLYTHTKKKIKFEGSFEEGGDTFCLVRSETCASNAVYRMHNLGTRAVCKTDP
jgi:hypothetical protein